MMQTNLLQTAVSEFRRDIEDAIKTAKCLGDQYGDGQEAKEALIRSGRLIMKLHEVVKVSISRELRTHTLLHQVYPPIGQSSPELKIVGFIKAKKQDAVFLIGDRVPRPEKINDGPLIGETDPVGREVSERSIVVGIRSQMSSVAKNFDTLMERAFAETLNLRLRLPRLVMAEVYLLPVVEYDDTAMKKNRVAFKRGNVPVEKFIRTFLGISGRNNSNLDKTLYKYERSCLLLVDCRENPPRIFETLEQLKAGGLVPGSFDVDFAKLSPRNFAADVVKAYRERH
jgi:hypothetical protein